MKNLFYFPLIFLFSGCALFDRYQDNMLTLYHNSLTKEEKERIQKEGFIVKEWNGRNSRGDFARGRLLIEKSRLNRFYYFKEIGIWKVRHLGSASEGWRAIITDSIVYDLTGFLLYKETYMDENNTGKFLFQKWETTQKDSIIRTETDFYPSGQVKLIERYFILAPPPAAHYIVEGTFKLSTEAFLENGQKCKTEDLSYYQWYEVGVKMKK